VRLPCHQPSRADAREYLLPDHRGRNGAELQDLELRAATGEGRGTGEEQDQEPADQRGLDPGEHHLPKEECERAGDDADEDGANPGADVERPQPTFEANLARYV